MKIKYEINRTRIQVLYINCSIKAIIRKMNKIQQIQFAS